MPNGGPQMVPFEAAEIHFARCRQPAIKQFSGGGRVSLNQ